MFEIKSFMTSDVITVKKDTPINNAIEILLEKDITGLPVVEDDMTLIGVISEKDILSVLYDSKNDSAKVEDFMTKGVCEKNCVNGHRIDKLSSKKGILWTRGHRNN